MASTIALQTMLPKIDTPFEVEGRGMQLRQMQQAQAQTAYQQQQQAQAQADDESARQAVRASGGKIDVMLSSLAGAGNYKGFAQAQAADLAQRKGAADIDKDKAATEKSRFDVLKGANGMVGSAAGALMRNPTRENAVMIMGQLRQRLGPELSQQLGLDAIQIPNDPAEIAKLANQYYLEAVDTDKQMEDLRIKSEGAANRAVQVENSKRSADSSRYSADRSAQSAANRLAFEKEQPRGVIIQSDSGPMLADPRSGTSRAVTGPDGASLAPKMKSLPAPIQKALLENDAALRKVSDALAAVKKYPQGLGLTNYLGDGIRQRTDPEGVDVRALVADIGSLKIHDRSGAAVTAAETPRLKPFIPAATDDPATVEKKLRLFEKEYQDIQDDIEATYTKENGYRAPARGNKGGSAKPAPGGIPAGWAVEEG